MRRMRLEPRVYQRITLVAVFLLAAIIVTGAAVRLTSSGLGCPEWPNCEPGSLTPRAETDAHGWVEFVNRMVTGLVSMAVILAVLGALLRSPRRRDLTLLSCGLVIGVFGQAVLGGLVVKFGLLPPFVMAHFLVSMLLLANAVVLYDRAGRPEGSWRPVVGRPVVLVSRLVLLLTAAVLFAGTVVTATGPHGGDEDAERFGLSLPHVTRIHGLLAMALLAAIVTVVWVLDREGGAPIVLRRRLSALLVAVLGQAAVGYIQYFNDIPELLVGLHIAGATTIAGLAVWCYLGCFTVDRREERMADLATSAV